MKAKFLFLISIVGLYSCKNETKSISPQDNLVERAQIIHDKIITLDTHIDIDVFNFTDSINYIQDLPNQVTIPKIKKGGLDVVWFSVYTGQDDLDETGYKAAYDNAIAKFEAINRLCNDYAPNEIALATSSEEVIKIIESGKKVAMIGVENAYPIGTNISNVEKFYNLGARYMSLAHNGHNQLSDSNTGENDSIWLHNGLSDLGKKVIAEMNRLGMMIDISHPSKEAIRQMIGLSKAPVIASHSSARALCDHSRNLDDEQLQWIKKNGGVVQTVALGTFLNSEKTSALEDINAKYGKEIMDSLGVKMLSDDELEKLSHQEQDEYYRYDNLMNMIRRQKLSKMDHVPPQVNVEDLVNHIDYLVEKMGIEHVGISSDFDGGGGIEGWTDASETFNVTLELVKRGYTDEEIGMLWSGNLLRVLDEVERVAKTLN